MSYVRSSSRRCSRRVALRTSCWRGDWGPLTNTLEKKEAQLNEVLSASKLEEVIDSKNIAFKDLQYELARVCKAHNDLLRTYEAKLQAFGIPMEELCFKPLESSVAGHSLGQGPAGLVSAPT